MNLWNVRQYCLTAKLPKLVYKADYKRLLNDANPLCLTVQWMYTVRTMFGRKSTINTAGAQHTQSRKILAPAFTPKACQQYIPRIVQIAEGLCSEWANDKHVQGEDCIKAYTFQVGTTSNTFIICTSVLQSDMHYPHHLPDSSSTEACFNELLLMECCAQVLSCSFIQHQARHIHADGVQLATELNIGFEKSFVTKDLLARHQKLYFTFLEGFFALPLNLPGFGTLHTTLSSRYVVTEDSCLSHLLPAAPTYIHRQFSILLLPCLLPVYGHPA